MIRKRHICSVWLGSRPHVQTLVDSKLAPNVHSLASADLSLLATTCYGVMYMVSDLSMSGWRESCRQLAAGGCVVDEWNTDCSFCLSSFHSWHSSSVSCCCCSSMCLQTNNTLNAVSMLHTLVCSYWNNSRNNHITKLSLNTPG